MAGYDPFEVEPSEYPQGTPLALEPPQEEVPFSPPPLTLELPIDIEGYETDISDSSIGGIGYNIWGGGNDGILVIQVAR